jgi:hypothetical protein
MPRWTLPVGLGLGLGLGTAALLTLAGGREAQAKSPAGTMPTLPAPPPDGEWTGAAFVQRATGLTGAAREALILEFVRAGAVPPSVLALRPVTVRERGHTATFWVMPDVLTLGTDADRFRPALTAATAQSAMDALGMVLPTEKIVRATYAAADAKIPLRGLPAPRDTFARHVESNAAIAARIARAGVPETAFVAGHSKDYVIGAPRARNPQHIAIYGGWDAEGTRIQMSSGRAHDLAYRDYSQRARGVAPQVEVDGVVRELRDVLLDPQVSWLLHDDNEGRVTDAAQLRYLT